MNSNFNLLNKCYSIIHYYNNILVNFNKSNMVLKSNIEKNNYELVECLFAYNINTTNRIKEKYLKDFLVKLSMLEFYTQVGFDTKNVSKNQYKVLGNRFLEVKKMTYGLLKNFHREENNVEL